MIIDSIVSNNPEDLTFIFHFFSSTGAVSARNIMLLKKKQARCQGVVCAMKVIVNKLEMFRFAVWFFNCF